MEQQQLSLLSIPSLDLVSVGHTAFMLMHLPLPHVPKLWQCLELFFGLSSLQAGILLLHHTSDLDLTIPLQVMQPLVIGHPLAILTSRHAFVLYATGCKPDLVMTSLSGHMLKLTLATRGMKLLMP